MRSLVNKHAIITGGSRGIGLAIAQRFASEGASVTLVGRDASRLQAALSSLPQSTQAAGQPGQQPPAAQHAYRAFDVGRFDQWTAMVNDMKKQPVDVLVNAAGITQDSLLFRSNPETNMEIVNTNLMGTIYGCQTLSRKMIAQKGGCIINVSSLLAARGGRGASVYAATKAGVVGLTRSLALEVGKFGLRVNVLLPGYIQTDMTTSLNAKGTLSDLIPLGRLGLAEEVADAAAFLAKNPYAHNSVLNVDGGLSAT